MDDSTLSKIKSESRQVGVEELAAFSEVFGITTAVLLQPLELALSEELNALLEDLRDRRDDLLRATAAVVPVVRRAAALALEAPRPYSDILEATERQDIATLHMIDVLLEMAAAIRGEDPADNPDSTELLGYE